MTTFESLERNCLTQSGNNVDTFVKCTSYSIIQACPNRPRKSTESRENSSSSSNSFNTLFRAVFRRPQPRTNLLRNANQKPKTEWIDTLRSFSKPLKNEYNIIIIMNPSFHLFAFINTLSSFHLGYSLMYLGSCITQVMGDFGITPEEEDQ